MKQETNKILREKRIREISIYELIEDTRRRDQLVEEFYIKDSDIITNNETKVDDYS